MGASTTLHMADEKKSSIARVLQIGVPLVSVVIALTSLFLGLSARRKELACVYLGTERLVSVSTNLAPDDLSIKYHGAPVTSLTKMNYVVRNAGATAIKGTDVVDPLELEYPDGTAILRAGVDKTLPSQFSFEAVQKGNNVLLNFSLLNPGDEVYFAVYVYNSEPRSPVLKGRIVDVHLSQASDVRETQGRPLPFISNSHSRTIVLWALIIVNSAAALAILGMWVYAVWLTAAASRWRRHWKGAFLAAVEELKISDSFEHKWVTNRADQLGWGYVSLKGSTKKHLKDKGVPEPPISGFDTVTEGLGFSVLLLGLCASFLFTVLYIYTAPR